MLTKIKSGDLPTRFSVGTDVVSMDNHLNFNMYLNAICKPASKQLIASI